MEMLHTSIISARHHFDNLLQSTLMATSHTRPKACENRNLKALIGRKKKVEFKCPSSIHTRRWRPKGLPPPKKRKQWMKSLHVVLRGMHTMDEVLWFAKTYVRPTSSSVMQTPTHHDSQTIFIACHGLI